MAALPTRLGEREGGRDGERERASEREGGRERGGGGARVGGGGHYEWQSCAKCRMAEVPSRGEKVCRRNSKKLCRWNSEDSGSICLGAEEGLER